jgi:hypothetical protein
LQELCSGTTINESLPAADRLLSAGLLLPAHKLASDAPEMNQNLPTTPANTTATIETPARPLDVRALAAALAGIRTDSQRDADTYLRDTVVPHGGE